MRWCIVFSTTKKNTAQYESLDFHSRILQNTMFLKKHTEENNPAHSALCILGLMTSQKATQLSWLAGMGEGCSVRISLGLQLQVGALWKKAVQHSRYVFGKGATL